jgi:hypothetical protein
MKILFLHGWNSTPGGLKPTYLKDQGHEVLNPALPDDDFDAAVRIAQTEFDRYHPDVVVGSSRGGAVAMNIKSGNCPLVLLCPAWKRWGVAQTVKPNTVILHSEADEVVPFVDSVELVRKSGLPSGSLVVVGHEHRLADEESLKAMLEAVKGAKNKDGNVGDGPMQSAVPFQFGISTLLLITAMYAVLFGMLRALSFPPLVFAETAIFLTAIGLGQIFLFKGQRPRMVSIVIGTCLCLAFFFLHRLFSNTLGQTVAVWEFNGGQTVVSFDLGNFLQGPIIGYVGGILIAGTFSVVNKLKNYLNLHG